MSELSAAFTIHAKVVDTWLETFLDTEEQISNEMVDCFLTITILSHKPIEKIEKLPYNTRYCRVYGLPGQMS